MKKLFLLLTVIAGSCLHVFAQGEGWLNPKCIKTYIPPKHQDTVMMRHAFERWSKVTKDRVVFVYVKNPENADLEVIFDKTADYLDNDKTIGLTSRSFVRGEKIVHATIHIADHTKNGRFLSDDEVFTVMLHEIGHAIGLNHVDDKDAIMNPVCDVVLEISESDMKQLDDIYGK